MLRILKRIISGVLTLSMVISVISFAPVYAATEFKNYEISDSLPQGWTIGEISNASIDIAELSGEKSILLSNDTSASKATAKANVYSESLKLSGKQIFSFRMAVSNSIKEATYKRLFLNDGANEYELLEIKTTKTSGELSVGEGSYEVDLATGEFFDILIAVDTQTKKAEVWLNNENVITTTVDLSAYVGKDVKFRFYNLYTSKKMTSLWYISKFERISDAEYLPVSNPEDSSQVADIESLEAIEVDFNMAIMNLPSATVTLEECDDGSTTYNQMEITVESDSHSLSVTPTSGFSKPKKYRLTVTHGKDVFNQEYDSYVMNFSTPSEDYVAPQCSIAVEGESYFVGETVSITAEITDGSKPITKAELYVNGELKEVQTDSFDFNIIAELGMNEAYIKVYDESTAYVQSNTVIFTVVENQSPVITFNVLEGQILEPGAKIKVTAEDSDGEIKKLSLSLDGNKILETEASSLEWTVPQDIDLGKHSLEAYAIDNLQKTSTKKVEIEISLYTIDEKLKVDFSTFEVDINSGDTKVGPIKAVANSGDTVRYIKNMNIDENHPNCAVMGSDVRTGGSTTTYLELNFTESTKAKNIAILETNLYASDTQVLGQFVISDKNGTKCTIIQFLQGNISCSNGDTKKTTEFEAGKWYDIRAEINFNTKTYTLFLNDEIYAENFALSKELVDISKTRIEFGNYVSGTGYVAIDKFNLYDKVEFISISDVICLKNGAVVEGEGANALMVNLKGSLGSSTTKIDSVELFENGNKLAFKDYALDGNNLNMNLLIPLEAGTEYKVEIDYTVGEEPYKTSYSFKTPKGENDEEEEPTPEDYVAPTCIIEVERENYFVGDAVNISAQITQGSEAITKAELYVNGELIRVCTDSYDFNLTAELGAKVVYIMLYDALGQSVKSNVISYTVVEKQPPVITFNVSDGQILEPDAKIKVTAEDTDGEIKKLSLSLDGNKILETEASTLEWTVPQDITLGKHSLEAYAIDNHQMTTTKKVEIEISLYTINEKLKVDFSTFELDINSGSTKVGPVKAVTNSSDTVRYIKNMNIDENHTNCAVMGSDVRTGGAVTTYLELSFSESTKAKNIAILETNLYASNTQVLGQFSLSDKNGTKCTIIQFLQGNISCSNGDTKKTMEFEAGKWYDIRVEINFNTQTYKLFLNDEIYAENFKLSKELVDISSIRIEFGNYVSGTGYVAIDKFNLYDKVEFLSISDVTCLKNGEEVEGEGADALMVNLKGSIGSSTTKIDSVELFENGNNLLFKDYALDGNNLNMNLLIPLEAGTEYKVEIDYTVGEEPYKTSYSFKTPKGENDEEEEQTPEDYVSPTCIIEVEKESYFVGDTVNISAQITQGSETITKAELYVNGELIRVCTDSYDFNLTAELGAKVVYIMLYDALGQSVKSNVVSYTVVEKLPPVITFNVSDGKILELGEKISITAEDTDGEVKKLSLRLDGKKILETETSSLEWIVPQDIDLGKHSLEAYAIDNHQKTTTKKVEVEISSFAVNDKVGVDFSTFELDINSGSTSVGSIKAVTNSGETVRYIKNMNIDENHPNCAVMGSDVRTGGSTTTYLELNFSESTKAKNIAILETNLYASDTQVLGQFNLSDKNGTKCTIIKFYQGNISCSDGDTAKSMEFEAEKWYDIRAEINFNTKTYTLFLNDEIYAENFKLSKELVDISSIRIEFGNYVSGTGYVAIDKFNLYDKVEFLSISDVTCLKNGEEVEGEGADTVNLILNGTVDKTVTKINYLKLFAEGKEIAFKDYKLNENLININLLNSIEAGYNYEFEVGYKFNEKDYKASYTFETPLGDNEGVVSSEFLVEDSNIKFSANVKAEENKTAKVIIVKYENNIIAEIQSRDVDLTSNSDNLIESPSMYFEDSDNITYKIYIWNSWENRTAIGNKIFELSN